MKLINQLMMFVNEANADKKKKVYSFDRPSESELDAEIDRFTQEIEDKGGEVLGLPLTKKEGSKWTAKIAYRDIAYTEDDKDKENASKWEKRYLKNISAVENAFRDIMSMKNRSVTPDSLFSEITKVRGMENLPNSVFMKVWKNLVKEKYLVKDGDKWTWEM